MNRSTRKWKKIATTERFTLHQDAREPTTFSVRWRRSDNQYGSRRFQAPSVEDALDEAPVISGLEAKRKGLPVVTLAEAFNECLSQTSRGPKATHDWNYYVRRFVKWLIECHADCRHWHLLTRQIMREYLDTYRGKSDTMRRLAMQPIAQTSACMHREYGFVNFAERMGTGAKLQKPPAFLLFEEASSSKTSSRSAISCARRARGWRSAFLCRGWSVFSSRRPLVSHGTASTFRVESSRCLARSRTSTETA